MRAPTLGEFAQQFGGAYLSTEGALWRTLKLLLLQPGVLTRLYIDGRRKHYVLPLRLYLTISLLVLLALRLVAQASLEAPDAVRMDGPAPPNFELQLIAGSAGLKDGVFYCQGLPEPLCKRLKRRIDVKPEAAADAVRELGGRFMGNLGLALFLLVPSFALFMKLVYLNRRLRYTEHLVFGLHVHACWFLLVACTLLPLGGAERFALLAVPVYTLMAMKQVYGGGWGWRWWRAAVVSTLYLTVLSFAMVAVALYALLT
ncbi:hypothetical protein IP87_09020 [beta proteobacterium AAP121]|nr:hypothetical protein IP80_00770 [beta proteobacterium AAP65]KPF98328.1 hypothetical protein IP87_09020 [beta proteobacterium AAP121]